MKRLDCISLQHFDLSNVMRMLWEQHVFWTRLLIVSILERLDDLNATQTRLLMNPKDFGSVYGMFYNEDVQKAVTDLLTQHLEIGAQLIVAYRDNNQASIQRLNEQWYENADHIASTFASFNPCYNETELRDMFYMHLDLTKKEVSLRLMKKFDEDVKNFDEIEQLALEMADYFTDGIICQFYTLFQ